MKILFVDDDFENLTDEQIKDHPFYQTLQGQLEVQMQNHTTKEVSIDIAVDEAGANKKLRNTKYDVLILDISIPKDSSSSEELLNEPSYLTGKTLAAKLFTDDPTDDYYRPNVVIFVTGIIVKEVIEDLKSYINEKSSWDLVRKPVLFANLAEKILTKMGTSNDKKN